MSRWGLGFSCRRRRAAPAPGVRPVRGGRGAGPVFAVEEYDSVVLLRPAAEASLHPLDVHALARTFAADDDGTRTVVATTGAAYADALWARLATLLDTLRATGVGTVRLVVSGAGHDRPGRPAMARRIANAWGLEVIAPDDEALVVPGGTLFVRGRHPDTGTERGWWHFAPGADPSALGPRQPAPAWQPAPGSVPVHTGAGSIVEQIPAGFLIRPPDTPEPRPGDLCYAAPLDPRGPSVLVGVPAGADVPDEAVREVVEALAVTARPRLRIAPGGRRDVLDLGQGLADALGYGVVVYTAVPLLSGESGAARDTIRATFCDGEGLPRWRPFLDAVLCLPAAGGGTAAPSPRPLWWTPPVPGRGSPAPGVLRLSERWQATATRAGLAVSGRGEGDGTPVPPRTAARPVSADGPVIELGRPGEPLDRSLWPELSRLLTGLGPDVRPLTRLLVRGVCVDGGVELRRLAALHKVRALRFEPAPPHPHASPQGG